MYFLEQNINAVVHYSSGGKQIMADKELQNLQELIRTVSDHLLTKEEKIGYLTNPELRDRLYGKFPECFLSLKRMGRDTSAYLLPICNRAGIIDPAVIKISYKAVAKLMDDSTGSFDVNDLQKMLDKLDRMKARYKKEIPKPPKAAARKAVVTRMFNNIKNHLVTIGPKE
jgi:hypothetical protein